MLWITSCIEILRSRRSLAVVAGMKNRMTTQNRQKSNTQKNKNKHGFTENKSCITDNVLLNRHLEKKRFKPVQVVVVIYLVLSCDT